ncbi:alkene reductase, partial [Bacillus subtilis]
MKTLFKGNSVMNVNLLFEPFRLGSLELKNRIVLPSLTRSRSTQPVNIPNDLMADYYAQRASAGFM